MFVRVRTRVRVRSHNFARVRVRVRVRSSQKVVPESALEFMSELVSVHLCYRGTMATWTPFGVTTEMALTDDRIVPDENIICVLKRIF